MLGALWRFRGVRLLGEADPVRAAARIPTFTFVVRDRDPNEVAAALRETGVAVASGSLGSAATLEALGVDSGVGALQAAVSHYHTAADIRRFGRTLETVLG